LTNLVSELVELAGDIRSEEPVEPVDLAALATDVAARFHRRTGRDVTVTAAPSTVHGRRSMLDRAVANLVDNALKFCPAGSTVVLDACRHGPRIEVSVADDGPGIAAEELPRLFDRFYQSRASVAPAGSDGGRGLGLAIVKRIAELHGGEAAVQSAPGRGTRIEMSLPAGPEAQAAQG
jgi:signal transduction histidine kinase